MRRRLTRPWLAAAAAAALLAGTAGERGTAGEPDVAAFVLRCDPRWADEVNAVLARFAQPTEVVDAATGTKGLDALTRRCGGRTPAQVEAPPAGSAAGTLRFAPCARFTLNAKVRVLPGDTLENIALRNGLSAASARTLRVIPQGSSRQAQRIAPKKLQPGDMVVIAQLPRWTDIVTRPEVDRDVMVAALAKALNCDTEAPDDCLLERGVVLLDARTPKQRAAPSPSPVSQLRPAAPDRGPARRARGLRRDGGPYRLMAVSASAEWVAMPAPAPEPARAPPPDATGPAPVAPEQWPYDADLLAAILIDKAQAIRRPAVIGVADGGLADVLGAPLPASVFTAPLELAPADGSDDDENDYTDDAFGAGVWGDDDDARRSGDVSLCPAGPPPFSTWNPLPRASASHGAVVASVAAALRARAVRPEVSTLLPRIAFFRMLPGVCMQDANFRVTDGEMIKALDYLHRRADVINISYTVDSSGERWFKFAVQGTLGNGEKVLVLPAGNDTPGDLDLNPVCPACLGNRDNADNVTANRTLVVGAATRALRRATFSNFGARTVGIYAPGEPAGALDVAGQDASTSDPATSYAAPYAALAVALLRGFGVDQALDVKDRLAAATWPLYDAAGQPEAVGVIDLVKVAAVRHHAVEVLEPADSGLVRRTYVGEIVFDTPGRVTPCPGRSFNESAVHAIRLGEASPDGERLLRVHKRNDWVGDRRRVLEVRCRPEGTITLRTLGGAEKAFPLADVTQILLRWLRD